MISHLVLVVGAYFPDSYGGAERQALILAQALKRQGVDVTLVTPTKWQDAPEVEETAFGRVVRFKVRAYPNEGGRNIGEFFRWTYWFRDRFGAGSSNTPIYVFHAKLHALGPALAARRTGSAFMIKLGGGGEASDFAALRAKRFLYGHWVQSFLLGHTDRFVANGAQIVGDLSKLGVSAARIAAFPNGVSLPAAADAQTWLAARTGDRFVFTGRMVQDKRVSLLYEAALTFENAQRQPHLCFVGDGPEQIRLQALPRTEAQSGLVSFPGFASDVYDHLRAADFFVSASLREGQSNSLLEAMSAGVIPVVARASGVEEVVKQGVTGFIVDGETSADFASVIAEALAMSTEGRLSMARAAREFAESHVGIDTIARRTLEVAAEAGASETAGRSR